MPIETSSQHERTGGCRNSQAALSLAANAVKNEAALLLTQQLGGLWKIPLLLAFFSCYGDFASSCADRLVAFATEQRTFPA